MPKTICETGSVAYMLDQDLYDEAIAQVIANLTALTKSKDSKTVIFDYDSFRSKLWNVLNTASHIKHYLFCQEVDKGTEPHCELEHAKDSLVKDFTQRVSNSLNIVMVERDSYFYFQYVPNIEDMKTEEFDLDVLNVTPASRYLDRYFFRKNEAVAEVFHIVSYNPESLYPIGVIAEDGLPSNFQYTDAELFFTREEAEAAMNSTEDNKRASNVDF